MVFDNRLMNRGGKILTKQMNYQRVKKTFDNSANCVKYLGKQDIYDSGSYDVDFICN